MKNAGSNRGKAGVKNPPKNAAAVKNAKKIKPAKNTSKSIAASIGKALIALLLVLIITSSIVIGAVAIYVINYVKPDNIDLTNAKLKYSSIVYANDANGNPQEIAELSGSEKRIWVSLDKIPENLKNAVVSTEDQRFYEHEGVDWKRTVGAFANFFLHFYSSNQGGSTITQQLVKNLNGDINNRTVGIKVSEIVTALDLEKKYSKDQILESYLNTITLGNGCYGVQTAANLYFGKDVSQLDLAQCAVLAGLTQSPTTYDPLKHADKAKARQKTVLENMYSQKMITKQQYDAAVAEKLTYTGTKTATQVRSWFVDLVINDVTNDLMQQKGYSKAKAQNMILTQGLKIYTTLDTSIQQKMDSVYQDDSKWTKTSKGNDYQASGIIIDYTGKVLAVEGGRGQKTGNMVLDRATDTSLFPRQPGSSIKPIGVYGPAIENDLINWSTLFMDSPVMTNNGSPWPKDDDGWLNTNIPVVYALEQSKNTVAVQVEQRLTPAKTLDYLINKMGFTTLLSTTNKSGKTDSNISIALGALTNGVTPREMAAAYEVFGSGGVYTKTYTYTKVEDADGNVVLQNKPVSKQAFSPETATIMNRLLQNVVQNGTGYNAKLSNIPVAGKTGTTTDNKDRWFVGLTPQYVCAVWTGYDQPKDLGNGANPAVIAWKSVMQQVEAGVSGKDFTYSSNVVQENYDPGTGSVTPSGSASGWYKATDPAILGTTTSTTDSSGSSSSSSASSSTPSVSATAYSTSLTQ